MDDDWFRANDRGYTRQTARSPKLRNNATEAEQTSWLHLSGRKLASIRFNRQIPIGQSICDFVSRKRGLVIDIDGGQHAIAKDCDESRTRFLNAQGYQVIRFWNSENLDNIDGMLFAISQVLEIRPSPNPSRKREGRVWSPAAHGGRVR